MKERCNLKYDHLMVLFLLKTYKYYTVDVNGEQFVRSGGGGGGGLSSPTTVQTFITAALSLLGGDLR